MSRPTRYEAVLILAFLLTLPLCNPWVRGDGVGYYAFARALLIEHRLDFTKDWLAANTSFRMGRVTEDGAIRPEEYTVTGRLNNHWAIGPAILWFPFLVVAHAGVVLYDHLGGHVPADGFSRPYVLAMAVATAVYGFLAVFVSFRVARKYVAEKWAFLAALGIWFGSALPVYMYFNPSWSHALSAFAVALFLWYWDRTRDARTWPQWFLFGAVAGLMMDVYYINAVVLILPLIESLRGYRSALSGGNTRAATLLFLKNAIFAAVVVAFFLPTLITKKIIYGGLLDFGYTERWLWNSPAFLGVWFSSDHGLLSWTPIIILSVVGLVVFGEYEPVLAAGFTAVFVTYTYVMGCFQNWDGLASFSNRYFVSLTPLFVLGLAAFFAWLARVWQERRAAVLASSVTAVLILWNLGLIYQWGMHLIPPRGAISWRDAAYNQVAVVPPQAASQLKAYFTRRSQLMERIESVDVNQLKSRPPGGNP